MKKRLGLIIIFLLIALIAPITVYLINFKCGVSGQNSDWGNFGGYIAGTVGVLFSFFSIILIYLTFTEQRNQQYEFIFSQILKDYCNILILIKERWLHNEKNNNGNPIYLNGREIFGNAVGYIEVSESKKKFLEIFSIHINVFDHYFNFISNSILLIINNNQLKTNLKNDYLKRFCSQFSFYELVFFGYYILYLNKNKEIKNIYNKFFLLRLNKFDNLDKIKYFDQVSFLKKKLKK